MRSIFVKLFLFSILLSSCGVITKARYGNGYKLNIEFGKDKEQKLAEKANKPKRKAQLSPITDAQNGVESTIAPVVDVEKVEEEQDAKTVPSDIHKHENQLLETIVLNKKESSKKESRFVIKQKQDSKYKPNKTTRDPRPLNRFVIYALLSFVVSIVFTALPIFPAVALFFYIVTIILSIMAISQIKRNGFTEKGYFLAWLLLILHILYLLFIFVSVLLVLNAFL